MKAVVIDRYGSIDELQVRDEPVPGIQDDEVLVKVYCSSVNPIDTKIRDGSMSFRFGKDFPKVLGFDFSGVVAEVGTRCKKFKVGDRVFGRSDQKCGSANAEFIARSIKYGRRWPCDTCRETR